MTSKFYHLAGEKIADLKAYVDEWDMGGTRICFYRCESCDNIQAYGHHEAEINSDSIGQRMGEDEECFGCGAEGERMKMFSIYDEEVQDE